MVNGARLALVRLGRRPERERPETPSSATFVLRKSGLHRISSPLQDVANSTPRRTQIASLSYSGWGVRQGPTPERTISVV